MKPGGSRCKGKVFERWCVREFKRWYPDIKRMIQPRGGRECPDIGPSDFWIECKHRKGITPWDMERAWEFTSKVSGSLPALVIYRGNYSHQVRIVINITTWCTICGIPVYSNDYGREQPIEVSWEVFSAAMDRWKTGAYLCGVTK